MESKSPSEHGQEEERQIRKSIKKADKKLKKEREGKVRKAPKPVGKTRSKKTTVKQGFAARTGTTYSVNRKFAADDYWLKTHHKYDTDKDFNDILPARDVWSPVVSGVISTKRTKGPKNSFVSQQYNPHASPKKKPQVIHRHDSPSKVNVGGKRHLSMENYFEPSGKEAKRLKTSFESKAKTQKVMAKSNAKSYHQQLKRSSAPKSTAGRAITGIKRKNVKIRKV